MPKKYSAKAQSRALSKSYASPAPTRPGIAPTTTDVTARLTQLRIEAHRHERNLNGGPRQDVALNTNFRTVHPDVEGVLAYRAPVVRPKARGYAAVRMRRLQPGPAPPPSWLKSAGSEPSTDLLRALTASEMRSSRYGEREVYPTQLSGLILPRAGSLVDLALRKLAEEWDLYLEYYKYHLPMLSSRQKEWVMTYVGRYADPEWNRINILGVLWPVQRDEEQCEQDGIVGGEDVVHLDLTHAMGRSVMWSDLDKYFQHSSDTISSADEDIDTDENSTEDWTSALPSSPFYSLTHATLAHPSPTTSPQTHWRRLISCSLPSTLTHLSLAGWPSPPSSDILFSVSRKYICLVELDLRECGWVGTERGVETVVGADWGGGWRGVKRVLIDAVISEDAAEDASGGERDLARRINGKRRKGEWIDIIQDGSVNVLDDCVAVAGGR
ncbi:hypothetical protein YB2330_000737 [Saitoella coloradoensis]